MLGHPDPPAFRGVLQRQASGLAITLAAAISRHFDPVGPSCRPRGVALVTISAGRLAGEMAARLLCWRVLRHNQPLR
jgi:hypothetical protein